MQFSVSDQVVVPGLGVGRITGIETQEIGEDTLQLFRIEMEDGCSMWMPTVTAKQKGLRPVMDASTADETLRIIASKEAPEQRANWNRRQRRYTEMLMSNDPDELASLLGELAAVHGETRKLSFSEKKMLRRVWDLLLGELSAATNLAHDKMDEKLQVAAAVTRPA